MTYVCQCMDCSKEFEIDENEKHIVCPVCRCGDIYVEKENLDG